MDESANRGSVKMSKSREISSFIYALCDKYWNQHHHRLYMFLPDSCQMSEVNQRLCDETKMQELPDCEGQLQPQPRNAA